MSCHLRYQIKYHFLWNFYWISMCDFLEVCTKCPDFKPRSDFLKGKGSLVYVFCKAFCFLRASTYWV